MRILVLGAGFGGLELTTTLSEALGDEVEITLIDKSDHFVFGFSKLDVMFGKAVAEQVKHPYAGRVKPGVEFVQAKITSIDAAAKRVETEAGTFEADLLVVAPARTSTPTPRPACSRAATSSTRSPAPSPCATCSPASAAGGSSWPSPPPRSSARRHRARRRS